MELVEFFLHSLFVAAISVLDCYSLPLLKLDIIFIHYFQYKIEIRFHNEGVGECSEIDLDTEDLYIYIYICVCMYIPFECS